MHLYFPLAACSWLILSFLVGTGVDLFISLCLIRLPQQEWKSFLVIIYNKVCGRPELPAASYNSHCCSNYYNWCGSILIPPLKQYPTFWDVDIRAQPTEFMWPWQYTKKLQLKWNCSLPSASSYLALCELMCLCVYVDLWTFMCLIQKGYDHRLW